MEIRFMAIGNEKGTEEREMGEEKSKYRFPPTPPTTHMSSSTSSADLESHLGQGLDTDKARRFNVSREHLQLTEQGHSLTKISEGFLEIKVMNFNENALEINFNELPASANRPVHRSAGDLGIVSRGAGSGTRTNSSFIGIQSSESMGAPPLSHRRRIHMPMMARCGRGTAFRHIFET